MRCMLLPAGAAHVTCSVRLLSDCPDCPSIHPPVSPRPRVFLVSFDLVGGGGGGAVAVAAGSLLAGGP
jgi:hypothetical protein